MQLNVCLMPLQGGEITLPDTPYSTFYLSQRPYLISGSLQDQILYPHPPAAVWGAASPEARAPFERLPIAPLSEQERDERLEAVMEAVELDYLLGRWATRICPSNRGLPLLVSCEDSDLMGLDKGEQPDSWLVSV